VVITPPNIPGDGVRRQSIGWTITWKHPAPDPANFPAIPERVETFILTMTNRTKAFTVLGADLHAGGDLFGGEALQ
jgi:hypothetical protein